MIVVPALTKGQQSHNPLVMAAIVGLELALAKGVADRVHAPGDVVNEKDTHKSSPQQTSPATDRKGNYQREEDPESEGAADEDHQRILHESAAIHGGISIQRSQSPAQMRVEEAFDRTVSVSLAVSNSRSDQ